MLRAEAVDFYPTLAALVGLPTPESAGQQINGTSLIPAFEDPEGSVGLKPAAFSQFAKPFRSKPFVFWPTPQRNETEIMGYTVRVDDWRYTCWFGFNGATQTPNREEILGRELYDHRGEIVQCNNCNQSTCLTFGHLHCASVLWLRCIAHRRPGGAGLAW